MGAKNLQTHSFSIAGTSTWSQGFDTHQEIIHHSEGAVRLASYDKVHTLLENMTNHTHQNIYCEEYAKSIRNFVKSSEELGETLDNVNLATDYTASSGWLSKQLRQVAKLIS